MYSALSGSTDWILRYIKTIFTFFKKRVGPTGSMEWLAKNVRSDLRQADISCYEMVDVQGGSETSSFVRFGEGGTDEKTGDGDGVA